MPPATSTVRTAGFAACHYKYNSPGPVFYNQYYPGPHSECEPWRYNYLNWIC